MALKEIRIRKSATTMTSVIVSLLLVIGIFTGTYLYLVNNIDSAGLTLDSKYSSSYGNMTAAQSDLEVNVQAIRNNFNNIAEADNTYLAVVNGMKGLGNTLKLPITFVDTTLTAWTALLFSTDFVPGWVEALIFVGLLMFVVFLVLKVLKGEPNL